MFSVISLLIKTEEGAPWMSYSSVFQMVEAAQRKARAPMLVRDGYSSRRRSSADDLMQGASWNFERNSRSLDSNSFCVVVAILYSIRHITGSQ